MTAINQQSLFVCESNLVYNSDLHHLVSELTGAKDKPNAIDNFLRNFTLQGVFQATLDELQAHGFTVAQAKKLYYSIRLNERLNQLKPAERYQIRSPRDAANYVMQEMKYLQQEHFVAIYLNKKNEILEKRTLFIGTLDCSIVHPREVFKEAFKLSAASVMVFHNHPSGNPAPTEEDIGITKRLVESGKLLNIEILDHIIIGMDQYISLKEKGYMS